MPHVPQIDYNGIFERNAGHPMEPARYVVIQRSDKHMWQHNTQGRFQLRPWDEHDSRKLPIDDSELEVEEQEFFDQDGASPS